MGDRNPRMNTLPNNFADFPPANLHPHRRAAARILLVLVLGGLVGVGGYRWAALGGDVSSGPLAVVVPLPPNVAASKPAPSEAAPASADADQSGLDVTDLIGNQPVSQNWAGYAATGGGYTAVSAAWKLPEVTPSSPAGIDAAWVGIGGVRSHDLIQAGTQRTVSAIGTQQEAWIELLPKASETVPLTLRPGDSISVSITQQGPESWLIELANTTSGQTFQVTRHYASSLSSAEWVEEAPSAGRGRPLPLDDFGTVRFSQAATAIGEQPLSVSETGAHPITMITPGGLHLVEPSGLGGDGQSFSVTRTSVPSPAVPPRRRRS